MSPQVFTLSVQNVDLETPCMTPNQIWMGLCSRLAKARAALHVTLRSWLFAGDRVGNMFEGREEKDEVDDPLRARMIEDMTLAGLDHRPGHAPWRWGFDGGPDRLCLPRCDRLNRPANG
jgi:hypothetical protein